MNRLASTGEVTPPTQWAIPSWVTLRVGVAGLVGAFPDGDVVADGDVLWSDEDVLDQQSEDALAFGDGGGVGGAAELAEEAGQVLGEFEAGTAVRGLRVDGLDLVAQVGFSGPEVGHPGAELVDGDELLGERGDHPGDGGGGLGQRRPESLAFGDGRVGGAGGGQAFVDLGGDQRGVGDQRGDVVPDDLVEVVGPDRGVAADPPAGVPVVVRAQAPVVEDLLVGGAGTGPVVGVTTAGARGQALQQGRGLGVPGGEPFVVGEALFGAGEGLLGDDRRDRDGGPLLAWPVDGLVCGGSGPAGEPGGPIDPGGLLDAEGLAEHGGAGIGGVAQHGPDHRPVPAVFPGPGGHVLLGQPAGQVGDRGGFVGVAAEQLGHQNRFVVADLVDRTGVGGLPDVAEPEWGT